MAKQTGPSVYLIVSDEKKPAIAVKAGKRYEVHMVQLVDSQLNPSKKIAARLCGETDQCQALIEI